MVRRRSSSTNLSGQSGSAAGRPSANVVSWAALITSVVALIVSASGVAGASQRGSAKHPAVVARAREAALLDGMSAAELEPSCPIGTTDLGTWCLETIPFAVPANEADDNNYFWAAQTCVRLGGYLPTAAQLIGAANRVRISSTITDNPGTAWIETDPTVGLQDLREMSATLVTVAAGSDAAGSEGVSVGSTGNPSLGQPNPTPQPANPAPETLQYVTVYSNHQKGGFAGSEPVSSPENFRCAFDKIAGGSKQRIG